MRCDSSTRSRGVKSASTGCFSTPTGNTGKVDSKNSDKYAIALSAQRHLFASDAAPPESPAPRAAFLFGRGGGILLTHATVQALHEGKARGARRRDVEERAAPGARRLRA